MPGWVELHCHSNSSFLDAASDVGDLVDAAADAGMDALALTDTNGLYGAVRFANAAKERGLKPLYGAELHLLDAGHLVVIARDRQGWTSLCRIISAAQLAGEKTKPRATFALVRENAAGLFALTGCAHGAVPRAVRSSDLDAARETLARLASVFGERCYVELSDHLDPDGPVICDTLASLAGEQGLGCVVTNNVHYARPEGRRLHDVLRCIDLGLTLDEAGKALKPNGEYWLKDEVSLRQRLDRFDEAFRNARVIADACADDLLGLGPGVRGGDAPSTFVGKDRLPGFPVPEGHTAFSFLYALCQEGARERYPRITPAVSRQLAHELDVIDRTGLAEFFLINWDIVRFCKERRIPAQGRGSAADSIVAYVLDITKVDPIKHDLLFERFLTEDSRTMPDIDLDIATNDREEVIQYVYAKYGERYAAMVCNVVRYRARSASREVAKALGFRAKTIDRMAKSIDQYHVDPTIYPSAAMHPAYRHPGREAEHGWEGPRALPDTLEGLLEIFDAKERERFPLFRELTLAIADFPRHLSIHNGGMLITAQPLVDTVPIERATMPGRNVAQFDKRDVEDLGLVKMDLLGLRTLSLVKDAVADIEARHGELLELGSLPLDDPAVYDLICEVDTIGLFQVESRAQAQALPRVRPRNFADIVVEVGFCKSHAAAFALTAYHTAHLKLYYPAEFYVGLLNNQPMGFYSPAVIAGDAERHGVAILPVDVNRSFAKAVCEEAPVRSPEGASVLAGPSLDRVGSRVPLRAEAPSGSRPVDTSKAIATHRKCRDHDVRIGFGSVKGLGDEEASAVVRERELGGHFKSFDEFATRVRLKEEALRNLALVGAFDSFGEPRRALLWRARDAHRTSPSYVRRALSLPTTAAPSLPPVGEQERTALDYRITGIPTGPQIMRSYREDLARRGVLRACDLESRRHGSYVLIAGAVAVKQHPETAKGHVFLSLEDETGISNIIIRPATYRRYKRVLDSDAAVVVGGTLQTVDGVISVTAQRLDALQLFAKIAAREWQ